MDKLDKLFFDVPTHKYTDEYGNIYMSMTTCIKKYTEEFKTEQIAKACERIGSGRTSQGVNHPKYSIYKGKSAKQLIYEWEQKAEIARDKGNDRHNYLEDIINNANKYIASDKKYTGTRIYTIQDIITDHNFGRLTLDFFIASGLQERYPAIFDLIVKLHNNGFCFYAEIAVFDKDRLVSGLIDLLAVHHEDGVFFIIDWKTNAATIVYESGYFIKDKDGNLTDVFVQQDNRFAPPIDHLPDSIGHKYSLQVSGYAALVELFGLRHKGSIICHIQELKDENGEKYEVVNQLVALDLKNDAIMMFNDFSYNNKINTQKKLFYE